MSNSQLLETPTAAEWLSLDDYVSTKKGNSILYVRVRGESMSDVGIETGDLVVVDRLRQAETVRLFSPDLARLTQLRSFKKLKFMTSRDFYI